MHSALAGFLRISLPYGHTSKKDGPRTLPCVSSSAPRDGFCYSWACASSATPKSRFLCTRFVRSFLDPEGSFPLHTVVRSFLDPEGSVPLHTGRALLPRSRRIGSVAHFCALLPRSRRIDSVAHCHAFLPRTRRFASVAHNVRFFHFPEGMFPSRIASYFFRSSEELLPSYAAYSSSTFPKVRFRFVRCAFLPPPRRDASATHGLSSLLPVLRKAPPVCREEGLLCPLRGLLVSPLSAEAVCGSVSSPTGAALVGPEVSRRDALLPDTIEDAHSLRLLQFAEARCVCRFKPSFVSLRSPALASESFDSSAFRITVGYDGRCPTPVRYSREV
jgi:hypothetical protein